MRSRGRPSREELVVVAGHFGDRPDPPPDATRRQAEIWRETVASEPSTFFASAAARAMLADYCRHRESIENVSRIINTFEPECLKKADDAKRFYDLLKMREMETRAASGLATRLRLTNQSRYRPETAATAAKYAAKGRRPWEE